jgi:hypothetical protein
MNSKTCEACEGKTEFRREGSAQGWFCTNCDWSVVTTYIPEIELDSVAYSISNVKGIHGNADQLRAVAKLTGGNFLEAKTILSTDGAEILRGNAPEILRALRELRQLNLEVEVVPKFKYEYEVGVN